MLILAVTLKASTAGDFFPLKPGSTFTYEEKGSSVQLTRTIGDALDMGGVTVTPITDRTIGSSAATTYYRVDSDQVLIVGYDVKHMMVTPMPLFKVGSDKVTWDYSGTTKTGPEGERLLARGESHAAGQREVLGKKVDVIEVKQQTLLGVGMSSETFEQKMIFGRGIGLIEWTNKTTLGNNKKKSNVSTYRLIDIQEPKPSR